MKAKKKALSVPMPYVLVEEWEISHVVEKPADYPDIWKAPAILHNGQVCPTPFIVDVKGKMICPMI